MSDWRDMRDAPRDGTPIVIAVVGRSELGWSHHELPYLVRRHGGRWCYARWNTPLFAWHAPRFWKPAEEARAIAA